MPQRRGDSPDSDGSAQAIGSLDGNYFRIRDFEYVQPLYDLAFLLEVDALAKGIEIPKYRTFSLWRAGYSLDGYGATIDKWLVGEAVDAELDYLPSARIRQYLSKVRTTGTLPELRPYRSERFERCLRLRSVRGLGPSKIALTLSSRAVPEEWFSQAAIGLSVNRDRILELYRGAHSGPWQAAHIVPPLLRFLRSVEQVHAAPLSWSLSGISSAFEAVTGSVTVVANGAGASVAAAVAKALRRERLFRRHGSSEGESVRIRHQMGWVAEIKSGTTASRTQGVHQLAASLDPLASSSPSDILSDLHLHTSWSDGSASVNTMAVAAVARGLTHFAVTDHSRSSKLQNGLTPLLWLRQANALALARPVCPVLHGTEVDIHKDGTLDLPHSLLAAADIVVASVHSNWTDDARSNTDRLLRAVESGCVDIIAHPTSALIGKPGVPDYVRTPADVYWSEVFETCARWRVAVELNCFPSRLDLPLDLLKRAIDAGCAISLGSDAHARSHLLNLRFGEAALRRLCAPLVLNRLSYDGLTGWIRESREQRRSLTRRLSGLRQGELRFDVVGEVPKPSLKARVQPPQDVPAGSRIVGIDLTAGDKATGVAILDGATVETCSLVSDNELLAYVQEHQPAIVSIDSPLGLPGGGVSIDPSAGIVRVAEHELASVGIPAYPALIDSMRNLTLRGIRLRRQIEDLPCRPRVIESYPGAAQDILCIPRKQKSLGLLREGLRRLGLTGPGLDTRSHDEMDAITSAIVGRYFEAGLFEAMGVESEAQLIVPKTQPLVFDSNPIICLAGKTGAGKSVVARYLSVFYGFTWIRTRDVVRALLIEDSSRNGPPRLFERAVDVSAITENDLREFGAVILDKYNQLPLRECLTRTVVGHGGPVVVDSVRDVLDVDRQTVNDRPVLVWFVDCSDTVIRDRLARRSRSGEKRLPGGSPVDRTALEIQKRSDYLIPNSSSLEELRWRLDDALFSAVRISK